MHSGHSARRTRNGATLALALACLTLGGPQAWACNWLGCDDGRSGYRQPARAWRYNGYRAPPRAYGYYGFNYYTGLPSVYIRRSPRFPVSGPTLPDAGSTGLTAPVATAKGLMESGLPARGPTLLGPPAPPAGYYGYNPVLGHYSGYSSYGYSGYYTYSGPPPPTAWLERRRRR
jgi:hypothetical protein